MNAHAMIAPFTPDFNTAAMANDINKHNFANLPIDSIGDIVLKSNQALYLYGGRKSLITALDQFPKLRIYTPKWDRMALFGTQRKVAGGTKTKQLLMVAPVPKTIPDEVGKYYIQVMNEGIFSGVELKATIQNLSK